MSLSLTAMALYAGLAFNFGDIGDIFDDVADDLIDAASVCGDDTIEYATVDGVSDDWYESDFYRSDALRFAQTVSINGTDAGHIRMDGRDIRFQESDNGSHGSETVDLLAMCDFDATGIPGESGSFTMKPSAQTSLHVINFDTAYDNPVFFAQITTYNGSHPVIAVPVTVYDTGAVVALIEPDTYDGSHASETVHWMVMEAGRYQVDTGANFVYVEAGLKSVTTEDYGADDLEIVQPLAVANNGMEGCFTDAVVMARPQQAADADYQGTRVEKYEDADGLLRYFGMRHMRRRAVEYTDPEPTSGVIGYLVVGGIDIYCTLERGFSDIAITDFDFDGDSGSATSDPAETGTSSSNPFCDGGSVVEAMWSQSDSWGNSTAGAGYAVKAGLEDTRSEGGELWVGGTADGDVTLLDVDIPVFDVGLVATTSADGESSNEAWLVIAGVEIDRGSAEVSYDFGEETTFFEASALFYGVTVSASAVGAAGVSAGATFGAASVTLNGGPYAELSAEASASIGVWCVNAGVVASLTLVSAAVPVIASAQLVGSDTYWSIDADLELRSLDGSLDLQVEWCLDDASYELFSISGFSDTYDLVSEAGCF